MAGARACGLVSVVLSLSLCVGLAQPYGIDTPTPVAPYLGGTFSEITPGGVTSWSVVNAFPNLTFRDPIQLVELPSGQFLIAGKSGELWVIDNDPATVVKTKILDIQPAVIQQPDGGLMGVVLHPEFGQAGSPNREYIYLFYRYTPVPGHTGQNAYYRLSRWVLSETTGLVDPASEFVMIQQYDRHDWHNGGGMFFHPVDGFLYITVGDEGGVNDNYFSTQKIDDGLFSGVLRIDVDQDLSRSHPIRRQPLEPVTPPAGWPPTFSQGYTIPDDNPWLDPGGAVLEEFWAIGLRSPHRMTHDPVRDEIWIGDVGQSSREEVSIATKGSNMQWPYREGDIDGARAKPSPLIGFDNPPVHAYPRSTGVCVIGGFVYRGAKWSAALEGRYLFADHSVRNVWALTPDPGGGAPQVDFMVNVPASGFGGKNGISSFATDSAGEVYILKLFATDTDGGVIYKLDANGSVADPPQWLSQLGLFSDLPSMTPSPGFVPYTVNNPLWSDRAVKGRWIALPNDGAHDSIAETIAAPTYGDWRFPSGTIFVKHFELPLDERDPQITTRLETRVLVVDENRATYGLTYRWNEAQTDAYLLTAGESELYDITLADGSPSQQSWDFPSRSDCLTCHNGNAGWVRGVNVQALNGNLTYPGGVTDNQLRTWNHLGMLRPRLREADIQALPHQSPLDLPTYDHAHLVRSYLDSNCAQCHRPGGANALFDARLVVPTAHQNIIDGPVVGSYPTPDPRLIAPQDPANSIMLLRTSSNSPSEQMPPLARNVVHDEAIATLAKWIDRVDPAGPLCDRFELPIPRERITLLGAHNPSGDFGATAALDGDVETFWRVQNVAFPHGMRLDFGEVETLSGLTYLPRQDGSLDGTIDELQIFTSANGIDFDGPISTTILPGDALETRIAFDATTRYLGVVAISSISGGITTAAEINVLRAPCATDCDPAGSVAHLTLDKSGTDALLDWSTETGTGRLYDVTRSDLPHDFSSLTCVESRQPATTAIDAEVPLTDELYLYLIRPVDGCLGDLGSAGTDSAGLPRELPLCPQ